MIETAKQTTLEIRENSTLHCHSSASLKYVFFMQRSRWLLQIWTWSFKEGWRMKDIVLDINDYDRGVKERIERFF